MLVFPHSFHVFFIFFARGHITDAEFGVWRLITLPITLLMLRWGGWKLIAATMAALNRIRSETGLLKIPSGPWHSDRAQASVICITAASG